MTITVYVAVSSAGHVATVAGIAYNRKDLVADFEKQYGRTLKEAGYRPVRATLTYEAQ